MATIKALEGRTVHQIQSGQVIVDLCSVAKELVENSLDAGATSIEVRFKNYGLDSIEVQDNGSGISSDNYETIALKHYTSKLSQYGDLASLTTFGFRGEALSSLCALSNFQIVTALDLDAPKGTRLDFETSGKLKGTSVVASQKGTTVNVENLFMNLPVRRRELEKNIKREYGKVLALLQAYACISTQTRISVSNVMAKGKKAVVFATKASSTTRENIANVFGAKSLTNLVPMDLALEMEPTGTALRAESGSEDKQVHVTGHVSRPVFGEGRQAPDRQMFFVNSRPCGLPQLAKVFNEVYKSYNVAQSPFVFANIVLDTNAYDVNVSPDKRTILLHEQAALMESLRTSLAELFDRQDQTVPQSQHPMARLPSVRQLIVSRESSKTTEQASARPAQTTEELSDQSADSSSEHLADDEAGDATRNLIEDHAARGTTERVQPPQGRSWAENRISKDKKQLVRKLGKENYRPVEPDEFDDPGAVAESDAIRDGPSRAVEDFNTRLAEQGNINAEESGPHSPSDQTEVPSEPERNQPLVAPTSSIVQTAFDRMRPRRASPEVATVTIGSNTTTSILGSSIYSQQRNKSRPPSTPKTPARQHFSSSMQAFVAPGSSLIKTIGATRSKARPVRSQNNEWSNDDLVSGSSDAGSSPGAKGEASLAGSSAAEEESDTNAAASDDEYIDEGEKKAVEEAKVAEMIRRAEEAAAVPSEESEKRVQQALRGTSTKDSTINLIHNIDASIEKINHQLDYLSSALQKSHTSTNTKRESTTETEKIASDPTAPDTQTLTITKRDFHTLHIIGQFNLGFILATRDNTSLFIIDQHASDEKINFETLQRTTVMQNQRLVHPHRLSLSAVDEEIILSNSDALLRNGFVVSVDESGDYPVGQRVTLTSLPMSKETTYTVADFEELVALLADTPHNPSSSSSSSSTVIVPRPTRTRKLFAMRACRSSIMIGKVMTMGMMRKLVGRMGEIDRPWNCPHGRPTMRHVCSLEGNTGSGGEEGEGDEGGYSDWGSFFERVRGHGGQSEEEVEVGDDDTQESVSSDVEAG